MDIKRQYNKIGRKYLDEQKRFFSKKSDIAISFIKRNLPKLSGKAVLDLGCGSGRDIKILESLGAKEVYGIDSSAFMISEAGKAVKKPNNLFVASMEKMPFKSNFFDVIIGRYSMHYLNNFDRAYREIARVLKKNGILILTVPHPLRDLVCQKNKAYGKQETIKVELYDKKVNVYFPSHTFEDYFSKVFLKFFNLVSFQEAKSPETFVDNLRTPDFLGIVAVRK